ncbi:uncharacterized protein CLUP02_15408 [Colletotrichum lupini]|uniref:Uncharacterized protein n=1 Tax=Colletotrichum lupini TaxID=145971 RepID=A0A9Q8T666_9PEZI|nr:uncharacterized protein CLUP02_15408 [Colletotrichum lupini]UQC89877.1 hypothetical protein CLUP02_15408 [Colletotrichum lupini]
MTWLATIAAGQGTSGKENIESCQTDIRRTFKPLSDAADSPEPLPARCKGSSSSLCIYNPAGWHWRPAPMLTPLQVHPIPWQNKMTRPIRSSDPLMIVRKVTTSDQNGVVGGLPKDLALPRIYEESTICREDDFPYWAVNATGFESVCAELRLSLQGSWKPEMLSGSRLGSALISLANPVGEPHRTRSQLSNDFDDSRHFGNVATVARYISLGAPMPGFDVIASAPADEAEGQYQSWTKKRTAPRSAAIVLVSVRADAQWQMAADLEARAKERQSLDHDRLPTSPSGSGPSDANPARVHDWRLLVRGLASRLEVARRGFSTFGMLKSLSSRSMKNIEMEPFQPTLQLVSSSRPLYRGSYHLGDFVLISIFLSRASPLDLHYRQATSARRRGQHDNTTGRILPMEKERDMAFSVMSWHTSGGDQTVCQVDGVTKQAPWNLFSVGAYTDQAPVVVVMVFGIACHQVLRGRGVWYLAQGGLIRSVEQTYRHRHVKMKKVKGPNSYAFVLSRLADEARAEAEEGVKLKCCEFLWKNPRDDERTRCTIIIHLFNSLPSIEFHSLIDLRKLNRVQQYFDFAKLQDLHLIIKYNGAHAIVPRRIPPEIMQEREHQTRMYFQFVYTFRSIAKASEHYIRDMSQGGVVDAADHGEAKGVTPTFAYGFAALANYDVTRGYQNSSL